MELSRKLWGELMHRADGGIPCFRHLVSSPRGILKMPLRLEIKAGKELYLSNSRVKSIPECTMVKSLSSSLSHCMVFLEKSLSSFQSQNDPFSMIKFTGVYREEQFVHPYRLD
jgi:hypothetical protein